MKNAIRLPGLIAFVVIVSFLIAGTYFFSGSLLKSAIESTGSNIVGARVDVESVALTLSPASIQLQRLTVADADQPMQNLFEFRQAEASVELLKLFMGQLIINELSVEGLKFETARTTSGLIEKKKKTPEEKKEKKLKEAEKKKQLTDALPSSDEILAREPLLVDQRKKEWDEALAEKEQAWKKIEKQLPDSDRIKSYEVRLKNITQGDIKSVGDFKKRSKQLKQLKKDIKEDKKIVASAKAEMQTSQVELNSKLKNLKNAPKEDLKRIKSKYSFDSAGIVNVSSLLFGQQIGEYSELGLYWYKKIKPIVDGLAEEGKQEKVKAQRKEGRYVRFYEESPMPDFLLKKALLSANIERGDLNIDINDLTHQQKIINRPTRLNIHSDALREIQQFSLIGVFDHREKSDNRINFTVKSLAVNDFTVSSSKKSALKLKSANANIAGKLEVVDGQLSGRIDSDFDQAKFISEAESGIAKELGLAIQSINTFNLQTGLSGSIKDLDFSLRSDLDKKLKNAFSQRLKSKQDELAAEVNEKLQQKLADYLKGQDNLHQFTQGEQSLDQTIGNLDKLLEAELDSYADEEKKRQKKKIKDKLKKLF